MAEILGTFSGEPGCAMQGEEALLTGVLAGIQQRGGYGYPDRRNITIALEQARGLPVSCVPSVLEQLSCGQIGTYARPSLRVIDTLTGRCASAARPLLPLVSFMCLLALL